MAKNTYDPVAHIAECEALAVTLETATAKARELHAALSDAQTEHYRAPCAPEDRPAKVAARNALKLEVEAADAAVEVAREALDNALKLRAKKLNFSAAEVAAAQEFISLRDRKTKPAGEFDKRGRYYPTERCPHCDRICGPLATLRYSDFAHCRSVEHIAALRGVSESMLKRAVKAIEAGKLQVAA